MPKTRLNPAALGPEPAAYSHAIQVEGAGKTLYVAGQIGTDASGACSDDFETQARQAWRNVETVLAEAGLGIPDIVKTTVYLTAPSDGPKFTQVRTGVLQGHKPASTLVYVAALAKPEWKVEIDVIAAR